MEIKYLNGEKVYVDDSCILESLKGKDRFEHMQVVKHNDLVNAINAVFEEAEKNREVRIGIIHNLMTNLRFDSIKKDIKKY